jgi:hypothetical protein
MARSWIFAKDAYSRMQVHAVAVLDKPADSR